MLDSTLKGEPKQMGKPHSVEAMDALNACEKCMSVLYCAIEADNSDDAMNAIDLAIGQLHGHLQIVRKYFELDKEGAAAC